MPNFQVPNFVPPNPEPNRVGGNVPMPMGFQGKDCLDCDPRRLLPPMLVNPRTLTPGRWEEFFFDRPTIIRATSAAIGPIVASPGRIPPSEDTSFAQSLRSGLDVFIPLPGKWYLRYFPVSGTTPVNVNQIDAFTQVESSIYRRYGFSKWVQSTVNCPPGVATLILAANPNRRWARIDCRTIAQYLFLGPTSTVTSNVGIRLAYGVPNIIVPSYMELTETASPGLWLGDIYGISGAAFDVNVQEGE